MGDDVAPRIELNKRKITKEVSETMEGDLTLTELEESLFFYMNGSSSPGLDSFTVNYLRFFLA